MNSARKQTAGYDCWSLSASRSAKVSLHAKKTAKVAKTNAFLATKRSLDFIVALLLLIGLSIMASTIGVVLTKKDASLNKKVIYEEIKALKKQNFGGGAGNEDK